MTCLINICLRTLTLGVGFWAHAAVELDNHFALPGFWKRSTKRNWLSCKHCLSSKAPTLADDSWGHVGRGLDGTQNVYGNLLLRNRTTIDWFNFKNQSCRQLMLYVNTFQSGGQGFTTLFSGAVELKLSPSRGCKERKRLEQCGAPFLLVCWCAPGAVA